MRHQEIFNLIHDKNIYTGFNPLNEDIKNFGDHSLLYENLIEKISKQNKDHYLIIEVGTWFGNSAIQMANICKKSNINASVLCIDTWIGSYEHYINPEWKQSLDLKFGFPNYYYQFLSNVIHKNVQDIIIPFPTTSISAFKFLQHYNIKADLIYIDAGHEALEVYFDIKNYSELLDSKGIIFGDDYNLDLDDYGVQRGLETYCSEFNKTYDISNEHWPQWIINN
jgi:hypothetical protein